MTLWRSSPGLGSIALTVALLLAPSAAAQVIHPEGPLPTLPDDGSPLTLTLSAPTPLVVVASTDRPDGTRSHAIVWTSGQGQRSWLYAITRLTFFTARSGSITLRVVDGAATATGPGVRALVWPELVKNWSFGDVGPLPGSGARLLNLSVSKGSGCPSTVADHWLRLDGGTLTTLLTTGGTGEGAGDAVWFTGTTVVWPAGIAGGRAEFGVTLEAAFPAVDDVAAEQRVVVYDVEVEEGALRRASRVLHRLSPGGLQRVREEQADPAMLTTAERPLAPTPTTPSAP